MRVSPSCIRQTYALSSSPPETAMELLIGSIDTEKIEAEDKDSDWTVLMKYKKICLQFIESQSEAITWGKDVTTVFTALWPLKSKCSR